MRLLHVFRVGCFAIVVSVCSFNVGKDKGVPHFDYREMGYGRPSLFIYHVVHKTKYATWEDTAGMFCSDKIFNSANGFTYTEWKFLVGDSIGGYSLDLNKFLSFSEGTGTKQDELFMHPARACYGELQCCPYPYFKNEPEWTWDFEVGEAWGAGPLFPIKGVERFYMKYKWADERETFETPMGKLSCARVDATCTSTLGTSTAIYYLHETYGLVYMSVSALDKEFFEFSLIKKLEGREQIGKVNPRWAYGEQKDIQEMMRMPVRE